jgi:hypothetical protein
MSTLVSYQCQDVGLVRSRGRKRSGPPTWARALKCYVQICRVTRGERCSEALDSFDSPVHAVNDLAVVANLAIGVQGTCARHIHLARRDNVS